MDCKTNHMLSQIFHAEYNIESRITFDICASSPHNYNNKIFQHTCEFENTKAS
jgi:hypothetical protein